MLPSTQSTLLQRIRLRENHRAWQEFYALYQPVVRAYALKQGLSSNDLEDVQQEVFQTIAQEINHFEYDRSKGRFSSWIYQITRNRVLMVFRQKKKHPELEHDSLAQALIDQQQHEENPSLWEQVFQRNLFEVACQAVQQEVKLSTWKAFWMAAVEGKDIEYIAQHLKLSKGNVYVAKSRVTARLKHHMDLLDG